MFIVQQIKLTERLKGIAGFFLWVCGYSDPLMSREILKSILMKINPCLARWSLHLSELFKTYERTKYFIDKKLQIYSGNKDEKRKKKSILHMSSCCSRISRIFIFFFTKIPWFAKWEREREREREREYQKMMRYKTVKKLYYKVKGFLVAGRSEKKCSARLTHYQMTKFRLFQTERVCRRHFQIWWKWKKVIQNR